MTDRAVLAARIRHAHADALPSFRGPVSSSATSCTLVAESQETENITLTVTIDCRPFAVEGREWDPAVSGTAVTVTVASTDAASHARRYVPLREPEAWARAVFAEFDDDTTRIYLLGSVAPDTGRPQRGLVAYRLYLDEDRAPIRVPPQLVTTPHYWIGPMH
ncbi:hypothetical protein Br6_05005 [Rhodococcus sp. Br-6]|nr:hypothetical protein Br6_05005 [Rhodococcus sp. Br-6]